MRTIHTNDTINIKAITPTAHKSSLPPFPQVKTPDAQIHTLIQNRNYYEIIRMLKNHTDPDTCNDLHVSALILAVRKKSYTITDLLLRYGANPNIQDNDKLWKCTALHWAVMFPDRYHKILTLLLNHQNIDLTIKDASGRTALDIATENYDTVALQLFARKKI